MRMNAWMVLRADECTSKRMRTEQDEFDWQLVLPVQANRLVKYL
jgi:hypothetical protein